MTQFTSYLTEEVVEDYADGIISRREALRRLGMLGVAATVAGPILAACAVQPGADPSASAAPGSGTSSSAGPVSQSTESVSFAGPDGRTLLGAWAAADQPRGAILVIHENRGLTAHIQSVAGRLASSGFSALAIDLLSEEGGTGSFAGEAEVSAALSGIPDSRFVADMKAGLSELERRVPDAKLGATGFCFGGGMVWTLLASGEPRLLPRCPSTVRSPKVLTSPAHPTRRCSASTARRTPA